jgi:hypothetical protein
MLSTNNQMMLFDNNDVKVHCLILKTSDRWDLFTVPFNKMIDPDINMLATKIKAMMKGKLDNFTIRLFSVPIPTWKIEAFMLHPNQLELRQPSPTQKLSEFGLKPGYAHIAILIGEIVTYIRRFSKFGLLV